MSPSSKNTENDEKDVMEVVSLIEDRGEHSPYESSIVIDFFLRTFSRNPEFFQQALKFLMCFCGLQASFLTWGYLQELVMTTTFEPTANAPTGRFPSAMFCVFCNRFLAVNVALMAVRIRHGAFFANNVVPLLSFTPCALSNTLSSFFQYSSLRYVAFPVQTVFKSSKIIPVMLMGKILKGTTYRWGQYVEALLITVGVAIFSVASVSKSGETSTQAVGILCLCLYVFCDSFTSQWQDRIYREYGRASVDHYQMMLGVNISAICITTGSLILSGDIPVVIEFLWANPQVFLYNVITAIAATCGQICIYYTIKEFGPVVFTIISTTRQMISIVISSIAFSHVISLEATAGACLVFSVIFYQVRGRYISQRERNRAVPSNSLQVQRV